MKQALPLTNYDESILNHLEEVEAKRSSSEVNERYVVFRFAPGVHEYFVNESLTLKVSRRGGGGDITNGSDSVQWKPGHGVAGGSIAPAATTSDTSDSSNAPAHPRITSLFHLFTDPRTDPDICSYLVQEPLADLVTNSILEEQYLQFRSVFDVIYRAQGGSADPS